MNHEERIIQIIKLDLKILKSSLCMDNGTITVRNTAAQD